MEYKVYALKDPRNKEVKYIGVTKNIEARYKQHLYPKGETSRDLWVKELKALGLRPETTILETINTDDRTVALNKEMEYIGIHKATILNIDGTDRPRAKESTTKHTTIQVTENTKNQLNEIMLQIKKPRLSYNELIEELIAMTKK